jgi:arylsulfatase A-like enzyme
LIIRYPPRLAKAKVWRSGVSTAALAPTILDAVNISLTRGLPGHDETPRLHESSLFRRLADSDTWTDPVIVENIPQSMIDGSFFQERAIRTARHKLILRKFDAGPEFRTGELYDLEADPGEFVNLYSNHVNLVVELAKGLEQWARNTGDETGLQLARYAQNGRP